MKLILVRHGRPNETDPEKPNDPPLNLDGWRQARAAADLLSGEGVTRIIASPLLRARQTAAPLAERLGLAVDIIEGWAEADRGAQRYRSTETLRAEGQAAWAEFLRDPIRYLGADPETFKANVLSALRASAPGVDSERRAVVFTHGMPINLALSHALGLPSYTNFLVGYGSVTRLRLRSDGSFGVASVNETAHQRYAGGDEP